MTVDRKSWTVEGGKTVCEGVFALSRYEWKQRLGMVWWRRYHL
jgi:hypothetical protein